MKLYRGEGALVTAASFSVCPICWTLAQLNLIRLRFKNITLYCVKTMWAHTVCHKWATKSMFKIVYNRPISSNLKVELPSFLNRFIDLRTKTWYCLCLVHGAVDEKLKFCIRGLKIVNYSTLSTRQRVEINQCYHEFRSIIKVQPLFKRIFNRRSP